MSNVRIKLLANRGVGKRYHNMSLTSYPNPQAKEVLKWIETDATNYLAAGRGANFFSEVQDGYDIAMMTSRALLLSGYEKLHCFQFQRAMEDDVISLIYEKHPPLTILNFHPDDVGISADGYRRLENCLTYYMDNCIPFFLHFPVMGDGRNLDYGNLMSPVFFDRVTKINHKFEIR